MLTVPPTTAVAEPLAGAVQCEPPAGERGGATKTLLSYVKSSLVVNADCACHTFLSLQELYRVSRQLASVVVPHEYGLDGPGKLLIGSKICAELLGKLLCDLDSMKVRARLLRAVVVAVAVILLLILDWQCFSCCSATWTR
jgi:hypothetical protein